MRNFFSLTIVFMTLIAIVSCSSPDKDGENLAKRYNHNLTEFKSKLQNEINSYKRSFSSQNFTSRKEARENYQLRINDVIKSWEKDNIEIDAQYIELELKYSASPKELFVFEQNFNNNLDSDDIEEIKADALNNSTIINLIKTIKLEELSEHEIKHDLVDRTIREPQDGYNKGNATWTIAEDDIKEFVIKDIYENLGEYEYNVQLILQKEKCGAVKVDLKLIYVAGDIEDWSLKMLVTKSFNVVKTGRYDEYITHSLKKPLIARAHIEFRNTSDINLMVGGTYRSQWDTNWYKFSKIIPPNGVEYFYESIAYYNIHFVEIPY